MNDGYRIRRLSGTRYYRLDLRAYVADYDVTTPDGQTLRVPGHDRQSVKDAVTRELERRVQQRCRHAHLIQHPQLYSAHTYLAHCRGGRLRSEALHDHKALVRAALERGEVLPSHVLSEYPDLAALSGAA